MTNKQRWQTRQDGYEIGKRAMRMYMMYFIGGATYKEIARLMKISPCAARRHVMRIYKQEGHEERADWPLLDG